MELVRNREREGKKARLALVVLSVLQVSHLRHGRSSYHRDRYPGLPRPVHSMSFFVPSDAKCIPAGFQLLTTSIMICPNLCCKGRTSHLLRNLPDGLPPGVPPVNAPEGRYICEGCKTSRMPLYNEIVWAKYCVFMFWPALTIAPPTPGRCSGCITSKRTFACVSAARTLAGRERLGYRHSRKRSGMMERHNKESTPDNLSFTPPMYVKIKSNKYVRDEEEDSICECKSSDTDPCGQDSNCINWAMLVECNPKTCLAGCQNQCFERKQYPRAGVYSRRRTYSRVSL